MRLTLERTAYVCGENMRVRAVVENRQAMQVTIAMKLTQVCVVLFQRDRTVRRVAEEVLCLHQGLAFQHVEYFIDKGVLGESKQMSCTVLEHRYRDHFLKITP